MALKLQMEAYKKSVDSLAKELETVAAEKHKKFLDLSNEKMSRVSQSFKGLEKKL